MKPLCLTATLLLSLTLPSAATTIPAATGTALDGHTVILPRDLPGHATVLILGFSQHSADTTTAWEKQVRASLATTPGTESGIAFYDMPFLEDAPSLIRPFIIRSIRKQVPDIVKPNFVPLTSGQTAWKQASGFTSSAPDAAYVLLVDKAGNIRWHTHEPYSEALFTQLAQAARAIAAEAK
jgi:hypothetical protein